MIKTAEEWITYAKGRNRSIFFYNDRALDLTAFMFQHPGGRKILTHYTFKDITETIFNVFPHKREQTIQVLLRYVVGSVKKSEDKVKSSSNISEKKLGSPIKDKKKVLFDKKLQVAVQGHVVLQNIGNKAENNHNSPANVSVKKPMTSKTQKTAHHRKENKVKKQYEVSIKLICDSNIQTASLHPNKITESSQKSHICSQPHDDDPEFEQTGLHEELDELKQEFTVPSLSVRTMNRV